MRKSFLLVLASLIIATIGSAQPYSPEIHTRALWHLDTDQMATTPDASVNGLNGLVNGNTSFVSGLFGNSAHFAPGNNNCSLLLDGQSQHGEVAANSAFDFGNGDFTFGAVIRQDETRPNYDPSVLLKSNSPGQEYYTLQILQGSTQPVFSGRGGGVEWSAVSSASLTLGEWSHVICVRQVNDFIIYLNGIETGRVTRSVGSVNSTGNLLIGTRLLVPPSRYFPGAIDEIQFWNRALTPAEIAAGVFQPLTGNELGLTACYNFDECSGSSAADIVGSSYSAQLVNSPAFIPAAWDNSNGPTGAHINCGTSELLRPATLTVDAWVYADSLRSNDMLIVTSAKDFHGYRLFLRDGGKPAFDCQNGTYHIASSNVPLATDTWHHLRGTFDGSTVRIYVDDVLQGSTSGGLLPATYPLVIGADVTPPYVSDPFRGRVDEVRILDIALEPDDCGCADIPLLAALNYPCNDASGTTVTDVSGHGNHGTLHNGATWSNGLCDGALDLDGVNDYVTASSSPSLEIAGPFTVQFSINPRTAPSNLIGHIIGKPGAAGQNTDWSFVVIYGQAGGPHNPDGLWFQIGQQGGNAFVYDPTPVPLNEWTCVMATFDGDTLKLLVNGELRVAQAVNVAMVTNSEDLVIGRAGHQDDRFFNGKLDAIRILPYDVTDGEPTLSVVGPGSGDEWRVGQFWAGVEWTSTNLPGLVNVKLYRNNIYVMDIATGVPANQDTLSWNVPCDMPQGTGYQIYVESALDATLNDLGNGFWIREPYPADTAAVVITTTNRDATLRWSEVTTDTLGNPLCPHYYLVFYSPIQNGTYYYHGYSSDTTYTHFGVVQFAPAQFYKVEVYIGNLVPALLAPLDQPITREDLYRRLSETEQRN